MSVFEIIELFRELTKDDKIIFFKNIKKDIYNNINRF